MGMSIDEIIKQLSRIKAFHVEPPIAIGEAIDALKKYQMFQLAYEQRLKVDMVAMLEDLRLRADETQGHEYNSDFWDGFFTYDDIIRAEINALKGETDDKRKTI